MPRTVSRGVRLPPFQRLVDDHASELHRFLVVSIGQADAEDCLQETLLSALRAYPRLRHGDNLRAWLYRIAQRKAVDLVRAKSRQRMSDLDEATRRLAIDPEPAPDDELWRSVRGLPAKQRAAVIHRFVFDLAYRDVGERMGISEDAARQNVSAGLRRLRKEVDG